MIKIEHYQWGIIIRLPDRGEIQIHKSEDGNLLGHQQISVTINNTVGKLPRYCDVFFMDDGHISINGKMV